MNSIRVHVHYGVTNDDDDALNKKNDSLHSTYNYC